MILFAASAAAQIKNPSPALSKTSSRIARKHRRCRRDHAADKFTYKPSADQITFAHLVVHMIGANYMLCGNAAGLPAPTVEDPRTRRERQAGGRA